MAGRPQANIDQVAKQVQVTLLLQQHRRDGSVSADLVRRVAERLRVSERTVWRWIWEGKLPRKRATRNRFEHNEETLIQIRAHHAVRPAWRSLRAAGRITCGENAFYAAFRRLDPAIGDGIRKGMDALKAKQHWFDHASRADHRNARWEIDDCLLPAWIWSEVAGKLLRPWLTIVTDCYTHTVLGFAVTLGEKTAPNAESVMSAIAEAILGRIVDGVFLGGLPDSVGIDLGPDYVNHPVYIALTRLGIEVDPAPKETPQDKPIVERLFGYVNRAVLPLLPGFDERLAQKKAA
jgi:transposase InsO family protein